MSKAFQLWLRCLLVAQIGLAARASIALAQRAVDCGTETKDAAIRKVLNTQFADVVNPISGGSVGNYGSYNFKDQTITFAGSTVRKNNIVVLNLSGSGTGGLLPVLDSQRVNSTLSVSAQFHKLSPHWSGIRISYDACQKHAQAVDAAKQRRAVGLQNLHPDVLVNRTTLAAAVKVRELADRLRLSSEMRSGADSLDRIAAGETMPVRAQWAIARARELRARGDSVQLQWRLLSSNEAQAPPARPQSGSAIAQLAVQNAYIRELDKADEELKVSGFSIGWWSFGASARNNAFKQFLPTEPLSSQLVKQQYVSYEIKVERSFIEKGDNIGSKTRFYTGGVSYAMSDNFATLGTLTLTDKQQYDAVLDRRSSSTIIKAATGDYRTGLASGRLYFDYYRFGRRDNTLAYRISPEVIAQKHMRGRANITFGLVALAKNAEKETTRINVEPYWQLVDVGNRRNSAKSLVAASQFGFRFTVPILFQAPQP